EQTRHLIVGFHLGNFLFYQLMVGDLSAEGFALVGVSDRSIPRCPNYSSRARSHREPSLLESKHCDLKAFTFLTDEVFFRHSHVLQTEIAGVAGPDAQLCVNRSRGKTLHASLNNKARHSGMIA